MSFEKDFEEPMCFSNDVYVISGYYSKEEATELFSEYFADDINIDSIKKDIIRFGFVSPDVCDGDTGPMWYTNAKPGKGSKPVWTYG